MIASWKAIGTKLIFDLAFELVFIVFLVRHGLFRVPMETLPSLGVGRVPGFATLLPLLFWLSAITGSASSRSRIRGRIRANPFPDWVFILGSPPFISGWPSSVSCWSVSNFFFVD